MAWSTIRPATTDDTNNLNRAARNFLTRHPEIKPLGEENLVNAVEYGIDPEREDYPGQYAYLRKLWRAIVKRTLGHKWAEGIAYGYVGFSQD